MIPPSFSKSLKYNQSKKKPSDSIVSSSKNLTVKAQSVLTSLKNNYRTLSVTLSRENEEIHLLEDILVQLKQSVHEKRRLAMLQKRKPEVLQRSISPINQSPEKARPRPFQPNRNFSPKGRVVSPTGGSPNRELRMSKQWREFSQERERALKSRVLEKEKSLASVRSARRFLNSSSAVKLSTLGGPHASQANLTTLTHNLSSSTVNAKGVDHPPSKNSSRRFPGSMGSKLGLSPSMSLTRGLLANREPQRESRLVQTPGPGPTGSLSTRVRNYEIQPVDVSETLDSSRLGPRGFIRKWPI